ncbi:site-specific integrase [Rhizobacter sp. Root404]|uniref:tyrosine-type recombinase/integrase n=1 Tax=Rhizobacter sp. Root404 TaxID=1736528 RepID=UPI001F23FECC|nr:site-specific integrase [Rhizobacter sp. Root404]
MDKYRRRGRAANTIHSVCATLALLYRQLDAAEVNLLELLAEGRFLSITELDRVAAAAQYRVDDLEEDQSTVRKSNVVNIARIAMRRSKHRPERRAVDIQTQASRLRYIADYLQFISAYVGDGLPRDKRQDLEVDTARALAALRTHIPEVPRRAKLGARVGLSVDEQARVISVVHPDSPDNPWKRGFVRRRNWLIVVLLLATGMRRGELLGMQIGDIHPNQPKLRIVRRADAAVDTRTTQPNTKTGDREIELLPGIMRMLQAYLKERRGIKAARAIPQVIVSDEGDALSMQSIDKLFRQLREACPGLPVTLTGHVLRHTWNERFSEEADAMGLSEVTEQRARNTQQGWADNSETSATYTRRHVAKKGQELALKLQEKLDVTLDDKG